MSVPTREQLKARSKHLAKLLQEKYDVKVSHGQCLDVISQLFGHKDWNTASAVSPEGEKTIIEPAHESNSRFTPWLEALTKGFHLSVEQPYLKEVYNVGGASAQHSTEKGVRSLQFTPRVDEERGLVVLTLEQLNDVSTNEFVTQMHKSLYLQREKEFAEKLGGKASDLAKK